MIPRLPCKYYYHYAHNYTVLTLRCRRKVFTYIYLGIFAPSVPLLILGAAMGGAVPVVTGWAEAYESYGTGGVMAAMLEPAGGFGKFVLVLLALSVIGNIGISSK